MAFDPKKKKPGVGIMIAIGKDKPGAGAGAAAGGSDPAATKKPGMPDLPSFAKKSTAPGADTGDTGDDEPDPNDPNEASEGEETVPGPGGVSGEGDADAGSDRYSPERSGYRRSSSGEVCGNCSNYDHANQSCHKVAVDQVDPNDTCGVFFDPINGDEGEEPEHDPNPMGGGGMMGGGGGNPSAPYGR